MYDWAEYRHFTYLLAVVEQNGFRAAAEVLHTTQPNLSAHSKQFQEHSGLHLYRKAKSGRIRLTATGIAFKLIAKGLLDARDECQGRSKTRPVGRSKSRPVVGSQVVEYSGAKGLWSVAEEALRP